jgi:lysine-specific demethylase 8
VHVNAWFGPRSTVSPLHYDPYHNLLCQVVGYKYIRLVAAEHTPRLYRRPPPRHNNSFVDLDAADHSAHPRFGGTPMWHG